ncbi:MAG: hypothetical protein ABIB71_03170 [Candidatus Woesearchaeota archaeon]
MNKRGVAGWIIQPRIKQILLSFSVPKTPGRVEKELGIKKLKLRPFLNKSLLQCLNPEARKGRFYILTSKARMLLKTSGSRKDSDKNWGLIGWVMASAMQRAVILKFVDSIERTSEEIRIRASQANPHLSRTSTKGILNELVKEDLAESRIIKRKRYYWISGKGIRIKLVIEASPFLVLQPSQADIQEIPCL